MTQTEVIQPKLYEPPKFTSKSPNGPLKTSSNTTESIQYKIVSITQSLLLLVQMTL